MCAIFERHETYKNNLKTIKIKTQEEIKLILNEFYKLNHTPIITFNGKEAKQKSVVMYEEVIKVMCDLKKELLENHTLLYFNGKLIKPKFKN